MSLISKLTGKELYWSILSGGKKLIEHQEEINKINVFPVPDGDTGSNLAATAISIIYNSKENGTLPEIASSIGDAALDGARGNSGVIFAQFLYGIGLELKDTAELSTQKFASIVKKGSDYVYKAIPHPKEGTIITVIREWADFIHEKQDEFKDFDTLLAKAEEVAKGALARTTEQLEALRLAKVVDAGAKGFVLFIEGMKETILNRAFDRSDHDMEHLLMDTYEMPMAEAETLTEDSLHNRYCTETCIVGKDISRDEVLALLEEDSDSIVIAGAETKLRLHFHTNNPAQMFFKLRKFGTFAFQKVDDMRLQYNVTHHRKYPVAFVVDSGVSVSPEFMDENQVHFIPAGLEIDGVQYQDGRTIEIGMFREIFEDPTTNTKTSQISPKAYADLFGYLSNYYESVIVLSMGSGVSGAFNSAQQGIELVRSKTDLKIDIINSKNLAGGCCVLAHKIADHIKNGMAHDDIVKTINEDADKVSNFLNFNTIDHMIKSGRLGYFKGGIIKLLGLSPVLEMVEGYATVTGKAFGFKKSIQKSISNIKARSEGKKVKSYSLNHSFLDETVKTHYLKQLKEILGCDPVDVSLVHPCIANHVGYGSVSVAVLYE